ncbi:MAG: hypothetical protein ACI9OH_002253 [Oleispira sp.]|jgi:hypothetical protein
MNAQASGQFFISIRLTTQFGITLEIVLILFSRVWNIKSVLLELNFFIDSLENQATLTIRHSPTEKSVRFYH